MGIGGQDVDVLLEETAETTLVPPAEASEKEPIFYGTHVDAGVKMEEESEEK